MAFFRISVYRWLVLSVIVVPFWAFEAIATFSNFPRPSLAQARRDLDVIVQGTSMSARARNLDRSGRSLADDADPRVRRYWRTTDSLLAIRFDDIQVRRPLLAWLFPEGAYVIRTVQTDPGGSPRLRYYEVDDETLTTGGYEVSAIRWWLGP